VVASNEKSLLLGQPVTPKNEPILRTLALKCGSYWKREKRGSLESSFASFSWLGFFGGFSRFSRGSCEELLVSSASRFERWGNENCPARGREFSP